MRDLLDLAHDLGKFAVGCEGNVSSKFDDEHFLVKASGTRLDRLTEDDVVLCDMFGRPTVSTKKPSMEVMFHAWLQSHEDVNYVAHVHPPDLLKVLCSGPATIDAYAKGRFFPDQVVFNDVEACVVPYAKPGSALLFAMKNHVESFCAACETQKLPKLILLRNHGIVCAGPTASGVLAAVEIAEKAAGLFVAIAVDKVCPNYLSDLDIWSLLNDPNEEYRTKAQK